MSEFQIGFIALVGALVLIAIWIIFYFIPVGLWFSALVSGVKINLLQLFLMRWRRVPPRGYRIVNDRGNEGRP